jgi:3-hydroxypropanoate dehydrogenase
MTNTADVTDVADELDANHLPILDAAGRNTLFYDARTANSFSDTPVSDEQLREIWDLAKWPPTSANVQPLRVLFVQSPEARKDLVSYMNDGNKAKTESAPAVALLAMDLDFHEYIPAILPFRPEMKDVLAANEELRHNMARSNATLQAAYFIFAVRAVGLAAGPMGGFDRAGADERFFPGGRYNSFVVINIGYPGVNPWFERLPRMDEEVVLRWT